MGLRVLPVAMLAALASSVQPAAQAQETGFDAALADHALVTLMQRAAAGDAHSQFRLGSVYSLGEGGVQQDDAEAVSWWRLAAAQGSALAQNELGTAYAEGVGVPRDERQAVQWFRLAAEQGLAVAQANLALMYRDGTGVRRNDRLAVEWYRRAAEQELGWAQYYLGDAYENGRGVRSNLRLAAEWYQKAAAQGYTRAMARMGMLYRREPYTLPTTDSASLQAYGEYWVNLAALDGLEDALVYLDRLFSTTCSRRLRIASGALHGAPSPGARLDLEVEREPACLLPPPGRTSAPLPEWEAVYLHDSQQVGFMRSQDLSPLN